MTATTPSDPADRAALSRAGLLACRRIGQKWALSPAQVGQLIGVAPSVDPDAFVATDEQAERISLVLGIWRELATVFGPDDARGLAYVRSEPELTTGGTVLDVMLSGIEGLRGIRRTLAQMADAWQLTHGDS